jgi:hypothetical protein
MMTYFSTTDICKNKKDIYTDIKTTYKNYMIDSCENIKILINSDVGRDLNYNSIKIIDSCEIHMKLNIYDTDEMYKNNNNNPLQELSQNINYVFEVVIDELFIESSSNFSFTYNCYYYHFVYFHFYNNFSSKPISNINIKVNKLICFNSNHIDLSNIIIDYLVLDNCRDVLFNNVNKTTIVNCERILIEPISLDQLSQNKLPDYFHETFEQTFHDEQNNISNGKYFKEIRPTNANQYYYDFLTTGSSGLESYENNRLNYTPLLGINNNYHDSMSLDIDNNKYHRSLFIPDVNMNITLKIPDKSEYIDLYEMSIPGTIHPRLFNIAPGKIEPIVIQRASILLGLYTLHRIKETFILIDLI